MPIELNFIIRPEVNDLLLHQSHRFVKHEMLMLMQHESLDDDSSILIIYA